MIEAFNRHRFGVNYTPTRNWWYCWNDFDPSFIEKDLDAIESLGADHIRIMTIWPYFHPNPKQVSVAHLDRLDILMNLAAERNLDVCVTMLTGWLSGFAFRQTFEAGENFFSSPKMKEAQALYFTQLAERLNAHKNFLGFDLGNELNCCWQTKDLKEGDAWNDWMLGVAEKVSPDHIHVNGVDHVPWFKPFVFSPQQLAKRQPIIALHCWTFFTGALEKGGALDEPAVQLAPAMAALARAYANDPRKPIWVQEFGASESWMPAHVIPQYLEKATRAILDNGICWVTWWCSHDLDTRYQFDPLEYSLGLLTVENKIKPAGEVFREIVKEYKGKPVDFSKVKPSLPLPPCHENDSTWEWLLKWMKS